MGKFQNKYRIPSTRLQLWDYRWAAIYFITICTEERENYFGEINAEDCTMQLSHIGIIADMLWHQIPVHSKNVELGSFVVMPNHIHGILMLPENEDLENGKINGVVNVEHENVETGHALSEDTLYAKFSPPPKTIGQSRFQNIGKKSVSSIIGSYKSAVTKHCNRLGFGFKWQPRFHDQIIRNDKAYQNISHYIDTNLENWEKDKFLNG